MVDQDSVIQSIRDWVGQHRAVAETEADSILKSLQEFCEQVLQTEQEAEISFSAIEEGRIHIRVMLTWPVMDMFDADHSTRMRWVVQSFSIVEQDRDIHPYLGYVQNEWRVGSTFADYTKSHLDFLDAEENKIGEYEFIGVW